MYRMLKYPSFLLLAAAFLAPVVASAGAAQEVIIRHDDGDRTRYYDRDHRDYHEWNDREDHSYRLYLGGRHREYREFHDARPRDQRAYWSWRHKHPDREEARR